MRESLTWAERLISLASESASPPHLLGISSSWMEALQNGVASISGQGNSGLELCREPQMLEEDHSAAR